jgi:hypothetical protein
MSLTIDLSKEAEALLAAQARAARMRTEQYVAHVIENALKREHDRAVENLRRSLDELASSARPDTTAEEMEAAVQEALASVRPKRSWPV